MTSEYLIAVVAIGSTAVAPLRLAVVRGVRRSTKLALLGTIGVCVAAALWTASTYPSLARLIVAAVALGWLTASWRARPDYGRRRSYPRGSLGVISSIEALNRYDFYSEQASRFGPVFKSSQYLRPVLCVVGLERGQRLLANHRRSLTSAPLPINRLIAGGLLRYMGADEHAKYRRYLAEAMAPAVLERAETSIAAAVHTEVARLADSSQTAEHGTAPSPFIDRLVCAGLLRLFFDIDPRSERALRIVELFRVIDHRRFAYRSTRVRSALDEIVALVLDQAAELSAPSRSPRSFLARALWHDPDRLDDRVFIENLTYFFHIARSDLDGLCSWLLKMLCDHREWTGRLRRAVAEADDDARVRRTRPELADCFVRETLRLRQSEYLYRTVAQTFEFEGFTIPRGWLVRVCIRESHVDPRIFENPRDFDPERFAGSTFTQQQFQPFGIYEHACMGVGVTATLARILVLELASRYDCVTVVDGPMELGLHHHDHWRPSSRWTVRLDRAD